MNWKVQIEIAFLLPLAWLLLRWRSDGVADQLVLGRYLVLAGAARFAIEFVRINTRVSFGLTVAHWTSLGIIAVGSLLLTWRMGR